MCDEAPVDALVGRSIVRHLGEHRDVLVDGVLFCGDPWCTGQCGNAKLIATTEHGVMMVSALCGVEQVAGRHLRPDWTGKTVEAPEPARSVILGSMWF